MVRNCRNCGCEISDESLFCPECGVYIDRADVKKSSPVKWILIALAIILLVAAAALFVSSDDGKSETALTMISESNLDASGTYSVLLSDENNNSLPDRFISVSVDNNTYTLKSDSNGVATINLTLSEGSHEITSYFKGDDSYGESHTNDIIIR